MTERERQKGKEGEREGERKAGIKEPRDKDKIMKLRGY